MDSVKLPCLHYKTHQMHIAYTIDLSDRRCLQYGPHQQDGLQDVPSNCRCLQYVHIKVILFMTWTNHTYVDYNYTYQAYVVYGMDTSNLCCLQYGHTKLTLYTIWTHQSYVVYRLDTLSLRCLQYEPIKLILLMGWTHETYIVYNMEPSTLYS